MKILKFIFVVVAAVILISCEKEDYGDGSNIHVDQYIDLLKSGKYDSIHLPAFTFEDIPALLAYRNETQAITNFPRNGISSYMQRECKLGMYVLWTIESIRAVSVKSKNLIGRFPSQNPILMKKEEWAIIEYSSEAHKAASKAYYNWWEENRNKDFDRFKDIDPLSDTMYIWH